MADQNFIDYVKICCRSGAGGAGSVHFHRDRRTTKGGPDGGDGGRGGHIILKGNKQLWTLLSLKYRKHVIAGNGENGKSSLKTGAGGKDVVLEVPLGTVARDSENGNIELEILENEESKILVPGGRGGKGNAHFKSSTNQAPKFAQPGEPGKEEWKVLELKVLADVGLVGFPNAGKSTLLSVLTDAKPKIADYAFTTLVPNLGIVRYRKIYSFIMADIPGIIENAHLGKGLGTRFLRHIERNSALLLVIPADSDNIRKQYHILLDELKQHNPDLLDKPHLVGISKTDILDTELKGLIAKDLSNLDIVFFSSFTNEGLNDLKDRLWNLMNLPGEN